MTILTELYNMSEVQNTQLKIFQEKRQKEQHYKNSALSTYANQKVEYSSAQIDMVDIIQTNEKVKLDMEVQRENGHISADEDNLNVCERGVLKLQKACYNFIKAKKKAMKYMIYALLVAAYFVYFGYAIYYRFGDEGSHRLLGFTIFAVVLIIGKIFLNAYNVKVDTFLHCVETLLKSNRSMKVRTFTRWFLKVGVVIFLVVYIVMDIAIEEPRNLISVAGLMLYVMIFYVTSVNPSKINWHPVFWGIALQYIFALLILRTKWGYHIFQWLGDRVTEFLEYTMAGVIFVFGDLWFHHFVAFKVLSIVVFFASFVNIMYFLGVIQFLVRHIGLFLSFCMDTSPAESVNAAGNIFVGMAEAPLMIRPFLEDMTKSELHAVMTGGFATVAGNVLGAYIQFGVPANHLISASVMSAPASLAISKLAYPETEQVRTLSRDFSRMGKSQDRNLIEAASAGATASIKLVGAIAVNLIAFLSLLEFVNATLVWFGDRVGVHELSFQLICSYILYPVAFFMGTAPEDCRKVAELIGIKIFTNEFIAYEVLKDLISNRHKLENYTGIFNGTGPWSWQGDDIVLDITNETLTGGVISVS
ncbi:hypothetical protein CHS0354_009308 [Potamilus streckersoni]|uniref:Sodium/nucleoside cotransporter n=1 Tax=Potamilus streckersoni TaxID=2493646 RepID=A0AAE0SN13_9BIVA|nr:hypothetical protein CHS0354_009308 [Potamilus streckersoni]